MSWDNKRTLCCIVPCFNESEVLPSFFCEMDRIASQLESEYACDLGLVLIDDGSKDNTLELLRKHCKDNPLWHYVSFTRNFGKEAGLLAGMRAALDFFPSSETYFSIMDADLQDPPALLFQMIKILDDDSSVDVAAAYRQTRTGESPIRSTFSHLFYKIINSISVVEMKDGARDFRTMRRIVVQSVVDLPETVRFSKGLLMWGGYSTKWIPYDNIERAKGTSKWNFLSLLQYALDGIIAFSVVPLEIISLGGLIVFLLALLFLVFIVVRALLFGDPVAGWPSLMSIITLLCGLQLLGMGILGLYLSKMYLEIKKRPLYLIREMR